VLAVRNKIPVRNICRYEKPKNLAGARGPKRGFFRPEVGNRIIVLSEVSPDKNGSPFGASDIRAIFGARTNIPVRAFSGPECIFYFRVLFSSR
jgi:hypothetical protein